MTPGFKNQEPAQPTGYRESSLSGRMPLGLEGIMKGLVSDILEEKLTQKFETIEGRLENIEKVLSKKHIVGIQNLILSDKVIDEIWDEEDDTL